MTPINNIRILRLRETLNRSGLSKTGHYNKVNKGEFVPPIALGERAKGYIEHEVNAVLTAMAASKSEDEIKALVTELVEQRQATA
jgi:prophage regulatory protein